LFQKKSLIGGVAILIIQKADIVIFGLKESKKDEFLRVVSITATSLGVKAILSYVILVAEKVGVW